MKTLCLKTEKQFKYLTTHLLDDGWVVDITEKGTTLQNTTLNQNVFILDMNTTNTELIEIAAAVPGDWSPRVYFYDKQLQEWEKGNAQEAVELTQEEIEALEMEIKQIELALLNSQIENNQNDNSTT